MFHAQICPTVRIVHRSAQVILTSKSDINRRVNEETEIYLLVARYKEDHLSNWDLSCGFDEQVNYFSKHFIV